MDTRVKQGSWQRFGEGHLARVLAEFRQFMGFLFAGLDSCLLTIFCCCFSLIYLLNCLIVFNIV